jgi:hypothetical protein
MVAMSYTQNPEELRTPVVSSKLAEALQAGSVKLKTKCMVVAWAGFVRTDRPNATVKR